MSILENLFLQKVQTGGYENLTITSDDDGDKELIKGINENIELLNNNKQDVNICKDRKSTRLNSSHVKRSRMPSSA